MKKLLPLVVIITIVIVFFRQFFVSGFLPIPSDTIVGMYHPFRDVVWDNFTAGVPFKNFLITDPVRQQYPWRELAIDLIKNGQWPLWNPYSFSGAPLLANLQSAVFYPLNFLFFLFPFNFAWGIFIVLEPLLAGTFLYLYLRNLSLGKFSSVLGAISFSFSGFFIAWLEWGTVLHVGLWLPLILLSSDKIFSYFQSENNEKLKIKNDPLGKTQGHPEKGRMDEKSRIKIKNLSIWSGVFIFSLISSFFAGHLQTFFYVGIVSVAYVIGRWWQSGKNIKAISLFMIHYSLFIILTAIQWLPTLRFINLSGRGLDQINWQKEGWFIPWQNLVHFLAPDFFGNPATLNYWGVWNYAEFAGYIGILPLILALYALFWRQDKKTLFFGSVFFLSLFFAFPTPLAKLPYQLQLPFFSTSQPTRLLFLTDFSLAVLVAFGMDFVLKQGSSNKKVGAILLPLIVVFTGIWFFVTLTPRFWPGIDWVLNLAVSKRNLVLPTVLLVTSIFSLGVLLMRKVPRNLILTIILIIVAFDLLRFGQKFTPFAKSEWLFPQTEIIEFLQKQEKPFRFMATDRRILPPNFSIAYRLESVDGYDPLYLSRYAELIAASERGEPNISPPFGFNRIVTPQNFESRIVDLLNVRYVLSLDDLNSPKLKKVFQEGQTRVYENQKVFPRVFLTHDVKIAKSKQEAINLLFDEKIDLQKTVILEESADIDEIKGEGRDKTEIIEYREQKIGVKTQASGKRILVVSQNFYPGWQAHIDGQSAKTYQVDYNLLGVLVTEGEHIIELYPSL